jgi:butyrate kinase
MILYLKIPPNYFAMENNLILAIKPEYTASKLAVYQGSVLLFLKAIKYTLEEVQKFDNQTDQYVQRAIRIIEELKNAEIELDKIRIVMGRGGLLKPIQSGVYGVNDAMKYDLKNSTVGEHSVNLGGLVADEVARRLPDARAYIADPVVVDELSDLARFSGIPQLKRKSIFHALNQKTVARKHAKAMSKPYEDLNLIVAHLGDGISIGAHHNGRVIDVNQAYDGEGPFSLERSGSLPMGDLVKLCYSGKYSQDQMLNMIRYEGGVYAYLGSSSVYELDRAEQNNDVFALRVFEAMSYQVAKSIGSMAPVFTTEVDAILLTGNLANNKWFVSLIAERIKKIAPVHVYPGEDVLEALAYNGLMLLRGEISEKKYEG